MVDYATPVNLGDAINTEGSEYEPYIAPDESYMIFMAARPDDLVNGDLYISYNRDGACLDEGGEVAGAVELGGY